MFFYLLKYSDVYEKKVIRFHVLKNEKEYFDAGCNGKKLETAAQSQDMFGCTIIVNHLEIRITRGSKYKLYLVG